MVAPEGAGGGVEVLGEDGAAEEIAVAQVSAEADSLEEADQAAGSTRTTSSRDTPSYYFLEDDSSSCRFQRPFSPFSHLCD